MHYSTITKYVKYLLLLLLLLVFALFLYSVHGLKIHMLVNHGALTMMHFLTL